MFFFLPSFAVHRAYYHPTKGSRYLFGRLGIGGTDFSTHAYTYDDHPNDTSLEHFALAPEDYNYKIPFMKKALELNPETRFFAATWSPPIWMKTNDRYSGLGVYNGIKLRKKNTEMHR